MMIQTHDLRKTFGRHDALRGLNLSVPAGSAFALIGANGAGKTTTIKVLMNLLEPTYGSATVLDVDSRRLSPGELSQIGYVSENQEMPERLTVAQFLDHLRPLYRSWDINLERSILTSLRLPLDRKIRDLSHGMRMKMALASALPFRPKLLVLDEPFNGLDPLIRDEFMENLLHQAGEMTILISTHELADIEHLATHVAFMESGQVLFQETMNELTTRVREVHIQLGQAATMPGRMPATWLQPKILGNVLSFVDTRFAENDLNSVIASLLPVVRSIEVRPIGLRSIFCALARDAQSRKN
jgi:ABC-type multidrug transport system ATPase subunit